MYNCAFDSFSGTRFNDSLQKGRPSYFRDHKEQYFVTIGDRVRGIPLELKTQTVFEKEASKQKTESIIKKDEIYFKMALAVSTIATIALSFPAIHFLGL